VIANERARTPQVSPEQLRYARLLDAGMRFGLGLLVLGFLLYVMDIVPARVALESLPRLWTLSATDYLRATATPDGWGWMALLHYGDMLPLLGVVALCGISMVCFVGLLPLYAAYRDWPYFAIALIEIGVLALAASGVLTAGH
jgi:hypothetical protein